MFEDIRGKVRTSLKNLEKTKDLYIENIMEELGNTELMDYISERLYKVKYNKLGYKEGENMVKAKFDGAKKGMLTSRLCWKEGTMVVKDGVEGEVINRRDNFTQNANYFGDDKVVYTVEFNDKKIKEFNDYDLAKIIKM